MKILHISRTMGQGGAEKVVYQLCKDCGIDSVVASSGGQYVGDLKKNGIKHYKILDIASKNPLVFLKNLRELRTIIEKEKITIVHSHHRMAALYAQILYMGNRSLRLVYTAHNSFYDKKWILRFALRNTAIVACGRSVKKNLVEYYRFPEKKIIVINNSIVIPKDLKPANLGGDEKKFKIGIIGRLTEQKGVDVFIRAFEELDDKVHGYIVGDGELQGELEDLARELNVSDRITFLGYREDVLNIIKALDLVVSASRWEGFPLVPLEAFGCGKTIVASRIPGNLDIIKDGINGVFFSKECDSELATKVKDLSSNSAFREALANNALIDFDRCYSYNSFIEKHRRLYINC